MVFGDKGRKEKKILPYPDLRLKAPEEKDQDSDKDNVALGLAFSYPPQPSKREVIDRVLQAHTL